MFSTIAWYTHFVISLIMQTPRLHKANSLEKQGKLKEKEIYSNEVTSKWAMSQVKLSGARVKVEGLENIPKDRAVLFVSNHQSNFDIALLMSFIDKPKGYISKIEMAKLPLLRSWMKNINCVFMDRSSLKKSAEAIIEGVKVLKEGHSLVIFPEGTRSKGNTMGEFKGGSFKLATKAKVPIIPVTINGSYKLMEANNNKIKPADVTVYVHPPVETSNLSKEELLELPDKVKDIIGTKLSSEG